ncbi:MAG: type II toxin-antitoxin system VapC family toxin [Vicinamibacterales bacterium]
MIVHVDTSALVDALTGSRRSLGRLTELVRDRHRLAISGLVYFEWRRGPRSRAELSAQESLVPTETIVPFGAAEASLAATLYAGVANPRGREIDLAIAACALSHSAALWTLNSKDFKDIPNLALV